MLLPCKCPVPMFAHVPSPYKATGQLSPLPCPTGSFQAVSGSNRAEGRLAEFTSQHPPPPGAFETGLHQIPENTLPETTCPGSNQPDSITTQFPLRFYIKPLVYPALPDLLPSQKEGWPWWRTTWVPSAVQCQQKRCASSTVQSWVGQPRAALPLLTGTRLGAALGQMIWSTCWRKWLWWRRRLLTISPGSPGAGREASPCLPDFTVCNDVINHPHTCLGLWLSQVSNSLW